MSVEINWTSLAEGPQASQLAETIRVFVHDRFQQVPLPRFIRSVQVHKFEFGTVAPEVVVRDICDPLPEFYQQDSDDEEEDEHDEQDDVAQVAGQSHGSAELGHDSLDKESRHGALLSDREHHHATIRQSGLAQQNTHGQSTSTNSASKQAHSGANDNSKTNTTTATSHSSNRPRPLTTENMRHSFLHAHQAAIPGGTSNLNHFHLPYSAPFSGPTTPLAAMAGGHFGGWPDLHPHTQGKLGSQTDHRRSASVNSVTPPSSADPGSRPPSQHRQDSIGDLDAIESVRFGSVSAPSERKLQDRNPNDIQIVAHVKYSGDMKLDITAELSLDYPMSAFVGIPLQLSITGFSFDGVAIIAHVDSKVHTCFLSPEDAQSFLGPSSLQVDDGGPTSEKQRPELGSTGGGLLEEIKVESEIGQKDGGKQVLKNVGKVEKFVLEQVRRIFEDEFVFPSFWTFLL